MVRSKRSDRRRGHRRGLYLCAATAGVTISMLVAAPAQGATITVVPNPSTNFNSIPFGGCTALFWEPNAAFFYKDLPAFELQPGNSIAFDNVAVNDVDIQLDVSLAPTTVNGGLTEAQPFTKVVSNTQTPLNPRGDTTEGNFELQYTIEAPFSFPGGGLIIRFSNPSAAYAADGTCSGAVANMTPIATSDDPSGFFLQRSPRDADGIAPWDNLDPAGNESVIGFRMVTTDPPPPEPQPAPQDGPKADGTLTIDANKGKVEKGRKVTLSGQLDVPSNESCEPGRAIQIQRRLKSEDDSKFATFVTVNTDATGNYSTKLKVKKTYFYRAVVAENDACDDETSNSQKVRVQKKKAAQEA